jgi:hypothetical protein
MKFGELLIIKRMKFVIGEFGKPSQPASLRKMKKNHKQRYEQKSKQSIDIIPLHKNHSLRVIPT